MKTVQSFTYLAIAVALAATTGCIAQSGTEEEGQSSQQLTAPAAVQQQHGGVVSTPGQIGKGTQIPNVVIVNPGNGGLLHGELNVNTGDPTNGEDGDGQDPQPVPWHDPNATHQNR
jgi:hypothetical protein